MCIDLHTHSLYSDGSHTPQELVEFGLRNRLQGLALTDHDTVEGVAELLQYGREAGLAVISGVEISTTLRRYTVHILGYGFDPAWPELDAWLHPLQKGRARRNESIVTKLQDLGIDISMQDVKAISSEGQTGRPHFAQLLVERGVVANFSTAFEQYLARGKAAWAPRFTYPASEVIAMIHRMGGVAILAHPGMLDPDIRIVATLTEELILHGLDGLEVHYPSHSKQFRRQLMELAKRHQLLVTGGSDFHGATRPSHPLVSYTNGFCPSAALLQPLLNAIASRQAGQH